MLWHLSIFCGVVTVVVCTAGLRTSSLSPFCGFWTSDGVHAAHSISRVFSGHSHQNGSNLMNFANIIDTANPNWTFVHSLIVSFSATSGRSGRKRLETAVGCIASAPCFVDRSSIAMSDRKSVRNTASQGTCFRIFAARFVVDSVWPYNVVKRWIMRVMTWTIRKQKSWCLTIKREETWGQMTHVAEHIEISAVASTYGNCYDNCHCDEHLNEYTSVVTRYVINYYWHYFLSLLWYEFIYFRFEWIIMWSMRLIFHRIWTRTSDSNSYRFILFYPSCAVFEFLYKHLVVIFFPYNSSRWFVKMCVYSGCYY